MNTNKVLLAALAGGVTNFLLGFLLYGLLLAKFFAANTGSATGILKEPPLMWALIVGNLVWGLFFAVLFARWASISTFGGGARAGAIIALLVALSYDFTLFATTNMSNLTVTLVDPLVYAVMGFFSGGVVGWVLGSGKKGA